MFKIPVKQIIVNKDSQVRLLEDDGTAYAAADATPSAGGFILEGFLGLTLGSKLVLQKAATRIIKDTAVAGVAEIAAYTFTSAAIAAGEAFRITVESLDLTPTEFQNINIEKRYQASSAKATIATVVAHIAATINADENSPVTAYAGFNNVTPAQDDTDVLVLVAKQKGQKINFYAAGQTFTKAAAGVTVYHTAEDTSVVTVAPALPVSTYDSIKNSDWAKNVDFDRNVEFAPEYGAEYTAYYFEVDSTGVNGSQTIAGGKALESRTGFRLYVKEGLTLETALNLLVTDMNV